MTVDPVCGMQVDEKEAEAHGLVSEYRGKKYYFCGPVCKRQFDLDPERYVSRT